MQATTLKLEYPPEIEEYVARQLAGGRFDSESELVTNAIQIVREFEARERTFRDELKRSIEQADRGDVEPLDTEATLSEARRRFQSDQ